MRHIVVALIDANDVFQMTAGLRRVNVNAVRVVLNQQVFEPDVAASHVHTHALTFVV